MSNFQKKIERITELAREKEQLSNRLGEIDAELEEMLSGGRPVKKVQKVRGGGNAKARSGKKGDVKHECCGSKQNRHKKTCGNTGAEEKPEPAPVRINKPAGPEPTWECLECSTKVRSAEQPEKCPSCPGRTMIQK